jgi:predicted O-linked N-acetylglucosamine transferase (SPINDLY family)
MPTIPQALATAVQHHQAGRLQAAEQIYREILAVEPNHADAWHLLGVVACQVGKHEAGIQHMRRAIELVENAAPFHSNLGTALKDQGKLAEAIACYRRALELNPDSAEVHNDLGTALKGQGRLDEAVACYRRALELKPDFASVHNRLGNALKDQGRWDEAVACYRRALELKPDFPEACNNLGTALGEQGKLDEAVGCYRRALELKPDFAEACNNLGNALKAQRKLEEAIACYRRALELSPKLVEAHNNLGLALHAQGNLDEAIACYRRALELNPGLADLHNNLGFVTQEQGRLDEAVACYRRALELDPNDAGNHSNLVYVLHFCPGYDAKTIYEEHRRWNRQFAEPLAKSIAPYANDRCADRPLRIGYVSPDFRDHVIGHNLLPLFRQHDRRHFEILCYSNVLRPDEITARFQGYAGVWRNVVGLADEALARLVREDRIDILVDLALHMARNRLLVFARKPAPVQVTFAGYPGTTGLSAIDCRLTDRHLDPPGFDDPCYSEESIRLPDTFWCYDPLSGEPAVNPLPALENDCVTFGCLDNFCKINASVLKLWAQVLKAVDRSQLVILAAEGSHRRHTLDLLEQQGVAPDRVTFAGRLPHARYLELYHRIDIGLDTFPYNGHTTSLDSFWMGVPVVTIVGQTVVGRAGLSQLRNLGLPELIAQTPEQFVSIAVALAGDLPRLSALRATLRDRMQQSRLMDAPRFARNIEAAYRTIWQRWCATQPSGTREQPGSAR